MQVSLKDCCTAALRYADERIKYVKRKFPPELSSYMGHSGASCTVSKSYRHVGCIIYYLRKGDYNNALKAAVITDDIDYIEYVYRVKKERDSVQKIYVNLVDIIIKRDLVKSMYFFMYSDTNMTPHLQRYDFMDNIYKYDAVKINRLIMDINLIHSYDPCRAILNNSTNIFNEMFNRNLIPSGYGTYLHTLIDRITYKNKLYAEFFLRIPRITEYIRPRIISMVFATGGYESGIKVLSKILDTTTNNTRQYSMIPFWNLMTFTESADYLTFLSANYVNKLSMYRLMLNILNNNKFNSSETFSLFKIVADASHVNIFTLKFILELVGTRTKNSIRDIMRLLHKRIGHMYFDHPEVIETAFISNFSAFQYLITINFPCTKKDLYKLKSKVRRPVNKQYENKFINEYLS